MTTAIKTTNTRPYMMIHLDCFNSKIFDNQSQRTVYMTLKQFADANNQCFPGVKKIASVALLSKRAVQKALRELKKKVLINIEERFRSDGSQTSNLYTIYDTPGLWTAKNVKNAGNVKNNKNTENANDVKNTGNADNAKNIKNTNDVKNIENANNTDNKTETAKNAEQYKEFIKEFMSMMETEGYVLIKKDDIPAELQDKFVLKSAPETVSDNAIMAQDESIEENNITEMEEIAEDVVVQEQEPVSNNATMPEKENSTIGKKFISKLKSVAKKEKKPTSAPTKATDVSPHTTSINSFSNNENDTMLAPESQPLERYTMEQIRKHYDYYIYMLHNPMFRDDINIVFDVLYDALNTTKATLRVNSEDKPAMVVISKLLKLNMDDILYVIETYRKQTQRIKNVKGYLLSMLYNAKEQYHLDIQNQVSHDMDEWYEQKAQEQMNELE